MKTAIDLKKIVTKDVTNKRNFEGLKVAVIKGKNTYEEFIAVN